MSAKYGIAEWFGKDVQSMSATERASAAAAAISQRDEKEPIAPKCPFIQALQPGAPCNKIGGVCSIRKYSDGEIAVLSVNEQPVTTCPNRFRERHNGLDMFSTIGEILFNDSEPLVVKEVPFLEKRGVPEGKNKAGRIDWIVLPRASLLNSDPLWAAVETQAIYFSGDNIWLDIEDYLTNPGSLRMPIGQRRPDYRSSGPKRLSPQLDVKAPRIGRWGRNTVVVVDAFFWSQMPGLDESKVLDPSNDEVIWVILKYDVDMHLVFDKVVGATMVDSRDALSGTDVMNKDKFTRELVGLLRDRTSGKVFEFRPSH
jgi:Restriction endonuclease NotI